MNATDSNASYMQFTNSSTGTTTGDGLQIGLQSDESAFIALQENSHLAINTNSTERIRITDSGKVGVGVSNPESTLSVQGGFQINHPSFAAQYGFRTSQADSGNGGITTTFQSQRVSSWTSVVMIGNGANDDNPSLKVMNGNAIFDNNVGIGTTSPAANLHISASASPLTQDILIVDNTVKNRALHLGLTDGNSSIQAKLTNGTTNKLLIQPSGSATEFGGNVSGSATTTGSFGAGYIYNKLGIGTTSPSYQLHTIGTVRHEASAFVLNLYDSQTYSAGSSGARVRLQGKDSAGNDKNFVDLIGPSRGANQGEFAVKLRNSSGNLTHYLTIDYKLYFFLFNY